MLGPSLLVAPVFTYSGDVTYYLPTGGWTNWFTGERVYSEHGVWCTERHGFDSVPLWVRDGSVIVTRPDVGSVVFTARREGEEIKVMRS